MRLNKMRAAMVGPELAVVIFIGLGYSLISGLAVGDAQWQYHTNRGQCDSRHKIVTYVPKIDKESGDVTRVRLIVPCNEWPKPKGK